MQVSLIDSTIVHIWSKRGFHLLRHNPSRSHGSLAAAVSCSSSDNDLLLLISSKGKLRYLQVDSITSSVPVNYFDPPSRTTNKLTELRAGRVISAALLPCQKSCALATSRPLNTQLSPEKGDAACNCRVVVCAQNACVELDFHSSKILFKKKWTDESELHALGWAFPVKVGPLFRTLSGPLMVPYVLFTVTALSGCASIALRTSTSFLSADSEKGSNLKLVPVVQLLQQPVLCTQDLDASFVVLVGNLCAIVIIYPDESGRMAVHRCFWEGPFPHLHADDILVIEQLSNYIELEHRNSELSIRISYDPADSSVSVWQEAELFSNHCSSSVLNKAPERQDVMLETLLRGIEQLTVRDEDILQRDRRIDKDIASYNSAAMFVREFHGSVRAGSASTEKLRAVSSISVDMVAAADSPRLHIPSPITGVECFITASFQNMCGVQLSKGWHLKIQLLRPTERALISPAWGTGESDDNSPTSEVIQSRNGLREGEWCDIEQLESSLGTVGSGERKASSFPSYIASHSAILASSILCYRHPDVDRSPGNESLDIEVTLCDREPIDILAMSKPTNCPVEEDTSFQRLPRGQLLHHLVRFSEYTPRATQPLSQRFFVPVPVERAQDILQANASGKRFKSILGGTFVLSVGPTHTLNANAAVGSTGCTITVRAAPHVLHFVKAAVSRRLHSEVAKHEGVSVSGSDKLRRWRRAVTDLADRTRTELRETESVFARTVKAFRALELQSAKDGTKILECQQDLLETVRRAERALVQWRRGVERVWSPSR